MKIKIFIWLCFLVSVCNSQIIVTIDSIQKEMLIPQAFLETNPTLRESVLEDVENAVFIEGKEEKVTIGKSYWSRFKLNIPEGIDAKILKFILPLGDKMVLYVPLKDGKYREYVSGLSAPKPKIFKFEHIAFDYVEVSQIDLERPFYLKNMPMMVFGINSAYQDIYVEAHGEIPDFLKKEKRDELYAQEEFNYEFILLIGMIMISFVFFLIHYAITGHVYFLFYSLYLFFLIFNYGYRTFYFYNWYSQFHEHIYFYINQNGQLLANLCYMFFVWSFIDIKTNYKKLYPIYKWTVIIFIVFIITYDTIIILNPFFEYHEIMMKTSTYVMALLSFGFVGYMFFTKRLVHTAVIFIGSVMLLIGYVAAITFNNFFILVPLVIVETIFFMSVIAYLDLRNFKKSLETDKLKEIDAFKSKFFTNISHEFRTPITLIKGPLEDQLQSEALSKSDRKNLLTAQRNTNRLENLVEQMLTLAKLESGAMKLQVQPANIPIFFKANAASFNFSCKEKNIDFTIDVTKDEIVDWFDADALERILFNLLGNAIKYTPENGKIEVRGKRHKDNYEIIVSNTGNYLNAEQKENIFKRFYQIENNQSSVGIGLALTKELTELHHGTITVNGSKNGMVKFIVKIPVARNAYTEGEVISEILRNDDILIPAISSEKIPEFNVSLPEDAPIVLIADDNLDIRDYIASIFNNKANILQAANGKIGFESALKNIPDIVISDVMMPEDDGFTFTKNLKENELTSHIPVILLTAKSKITDKLEGMNIGADAYITKPFSSQLLKATVENLLENRRKLQQRFSQEIILMPKDIAVSSADEKFLERLQEVMDICITKSDFSAEEFSTEMGVSRMQLHRKLKGLTGQSTSEFLRSQRLKLAATLLRTHKVSISEAGYTVGFNDPSYFAKCFKQEFGCSPSDYISK